VAHSDFIFSVLAEELGLVGVLVLFALLLLLIYRVLHVAERARDDFGRLLATGVAAMLGFQAIVNVGANLTLLPVAGIPLPFISSGGSALITNLAALGIVQSVLLYRLRFRY
jgi:rod shape determining protein RodA